ncbi:hypothetical protein Cni_G14194 [Canna indica]|uniref:Uncharacterized protein n=1 Tax=Canna indica TaxID=4628 RepID=A0AAQ3KDN3_9LILI|nr:hypothetical protein Cni_G14194 [Canna indica]
MASIGDGLEPMALEAQVDGASPSTPTPSHVSNILSSSSVVGPEEPNYTRKVFLQPEGDDGFCPSKPNTSQISTIIINRSDDAYESWTKIPEATRRIWFRERKKHVYWEPMHEDHMWHAFNKKGSSRLSDMYCALRKSNKRPHWIGTEIWEGLRQIWSTEKHKQKSERGKKNRNSERGGSFHTWGCISFGKHKMRMDRYEQEHSQSETQSQSEDGGIPTLDTQESEVDKWSRAIDVQTRGVTFMG